jgi:hypothetical protein
MSGVVRRGGPLTTGVVRRLRERRDQVPAGGADLDRATGRVGADQRRQSTVDIAITGWLLLGQVQIAGGAVLLGGALTGPVELARAGIRAGVGQTGMTVGTIIGLRRYS